MARNKKAQPRKILTLNDLYSFYAHKNETCSFSAKESGYQISVQVPAQFEINEEYSDDSLLFCLVKIFHTGENRNHSSVTEDAAKKAMKTLAYKPVLANFCEIEDENGEMVKDFTSHDMEIDENGKVNYLEHQIGCFTADEPFMELEEETGHNFVYGYCAIPREYTDACSIIERKGGTKVSVELSVNDMQYSSESKVLELTDVVIMGVTCLGTNPNTGEEVQEGMKNARLDIADFSTKNNSILNYSEQLIEVQEKLNALLSHFNIEDSVKGGETEVETEKNFEEVTEAENVEVTEEATTEEVTVIENESEETVVESSEEVEQSEEPTVEMQNEEVSVETEVPEESFEAIRKGTIEIGDSTKTFQISLDEKIYALENLANVTYGESDNEYYMVKVYDSEVVMIGWWTGHAYKQSYSETDGTFALVGDRVEVFAQYLTKEEIEAVEDMRANYSEIQEKLHAYEYNEEFADKMTVFEDEAYSNYLETEEFVALMSKESVDMYSKSELQEKADAVLGKLVKQSKTFSYSEKRNINKVNIPTTNIEEKTNPYGNLFD